jgi:DNA-binding transcriptional ArsR family regulator
VHAEDVFVALSDPTRREVIAELARHGACTATELAVGMPITRQAVAKHLTLLRCSGLVVRERRGRETHYRLVPKAFGEAIVWLEQLSGQAERTLHAA